MAGAMSVSVEWNASIVGALTLQNFIRSNVTFLSDQKLASPHGVLRGDRVGWEDRLVAGRTSWSVIRSAGLPHQALSRHAGASSKFFFSRSFAQVGNIKWSGYAHWDLPAAMPLRLAIHHHTPTHPIVGLVRQYPSNKAARFCSHGQFTPSCGATHRTDQIKICG